jgi:hypothetical protein
MYVSVYILFICMYANGKYCLNRGFRKMPFTFAWTEGTAQPNLESALSISGNFPTLAILSMDKKVHSDILSYRHNRAMTSSSIHTYTFRFTLLYITYIHIHTCSCRWCLLVTKRSRKRVYFHTYIHIYIHTHMYVHTYKKISPCRIDTYIYNIYILAFTHNQKHVFLGVCCE